MHLKIGQMAADGEIWMAPAATGGIMIPHSDERVQAERVRLVLCVLLLSILIASVCHGLLGLTAA